jgi:chemotaxis protein MotB
MGQSHHEEEEPHVAHDESNWLVSYADMMTLLFGFFVLMYSMSRVDSDKFAVVSQDLARYFGGKVQEDAGVKVATEDLKKYLGTVMKEIKEKGPSKEAVGDVALGGASPTAEESKEDLPIEKALEINEGLSSLVLKFKGSLLFNSGSAQLKPEFEKVINELGQKLLASQRIEEIKVEGHTDDSPIKSMVFPTNWELSAARSTRIARQFEAVGVDSKLLVAEGFGSSRPDLPNRDPQGKPIKDNQAQNRRVVIKVQFTKSKQAGPDDLRAQYFEKIKQKRNQPQAQVADTGALGDAGSSDEIGQRIQEAQRRLEEAQSRLKATEAENRRKQKLVDLEKKLDQLNKKTEEVEKKLNTKEPASVPGGR